MSTVSASDTARWPGVLALLVVIVVAYVDRVNVSVLIVDPAFLAQFGLTGDRPAQGLLMSVFLIAYGLAALLLTPFYESRLGFRRGLLLSMCLWALLTAISPLCGSLFALLLVRALLGASEGPLFSLKTMYVREHFAAHERGKPNAVSSMGVSLGLALGFPLVSALLHSVGWAASYPLLAMLNLLLGLPLVWLFVRNRTPEAGEHTQRSIRYTVAQALRTRHLAAIILIEVFTLAYLWGSSAWLPAYLVSDKGFSVRQMGWVSALPFLVSLSANFIGGASVDRLPVRLTTLVFVIGGAFCATCVLLLIDSHSTTGTLMLLLGASFAWGIQGAAIPTLIQRYAPADAVGSAYGLINGIGNMVSAFMPLAMGGLMSTQVSSGFWLLIGAQVCVAVCGLWMIQACREPARLNTEETRA